MAFDLKAAETHSRLSVACGVASGLAALFALWMLSRNYEGSAKFVYYSQSGLWLPIFLVAILFGLLFGAGGFLLGLTSAAKKRNALTRLSWIGFFVSAGMVTLTLCAGVFFYFTRNAVK